MLSSTQKIIQALIPYAKEPNSLDSTINSFN